VLIKDAATAFPSTKGLGWCSKKRGVEKGVVLGFKWHTPLHSGKGA
jgi:hypothetical protein